MTQRPIPFKTIALAIAILLGLALSARAAPDCGGSIGIRGQPCEETGG